jgi:hypothetical protein
MAMLMGTGTMSGAAQSLLTLLFPAPANSVVGGPNDVACNFVSIQPDGATTGAIFIGSDSTTSSTVYGNRLPASAAGVPPAPYVIGSWSDKGPVRLSNVFLVGTVSEKVHVLYCLW